MGFIRPIDVVAPEGFGASSGTFAAPVTFFGRLIRTIKASRSRVTITSINASFTTANIGAASSSRVFTCGITVFRQSQSNPFPDPNLATITVAPVMPAGVDCLFQQNIFGTVTSNAGGNGAFPSPLSQNSFRFLPGEIAADVGQLLLVVMQQPTTADGLAFVGGTSILAVGGFDYGIDQNPNNPKPEERSFPRF